MLSPYIAHPCAAALAPACPGDRAGAVGIGWTVLIPRGAVPRVAESRTEQPRSSQKISNPAISRVQISLKALSESLQLLWRMDAGEYHIPELIALACEDIFTYQLISCCCFSPLAEVISHLEVRIFSVGPPLPSRLRSSSVSAETGTETRERTAMATAIVLMIVFPRLSSLTLMAAMCFDHPMPS
jgi:hypothetical protein